MTIATKKRLLLDGVSGDAYVEFDGTSINIVVGGVTVASWNSAGSSVLNADSGTTTASGTGGTSTATLSKMAGIITTDAITTAAGATHTMTITNTLVASGDLVLVWLVGGANTKPGTQIEALAGSSAITVKIKNNNAAAIDGTVIFGFMVVKA